MCIVIDAGALASVFNPSCTEHAEFKPVADWILKGRGRAVFGGTKYKTELARARRYLRLFLQLKIQGRAIEIRGDLVDAREAALVEMTRGSDCDDQHIIAILCVSKCLLLCSQDGRSYCFVKDKRNYPKKQKVPRIYSSHKNRDLLCDHNIVPLLNIA